MTTTQIMYAIGTRILARMQESAIPVAAAIAPPLSEQEGLSFVIENPDSDEHESADQPDGHVEDSEHT